MKPLPLPSRGPSSLRLLRLLQPGSLRLRLLRLGSLRLRLLRLGSRTPPPQPIQSRALVGVPLQGSGQRQLQW